MATHYKVVKVHYKNYKGEHVSTFNIKWKWTLFGFPITPWCTLKEMSNPYGGETAISFKTRSDASERIDELENPDNYWYEEDV